MPRVIHSLFNTKVLFSISHSDIIIKIVRVGSYAMRINLLQLKIIIKTMSKIYAA
jgi:hypothetical protein